MLGPILAAIWRAVAGPVAILLAAGLVWQSAQLAVTERRLSWATKERDAAGQDLAVCRANVATLRSGVEAQNRAVDALRAEADARVGQSAQALSAAQKSALAADRRAMAILNAKAGGDLCAAAERLMREAGR